MDSLPTAGEEPQFLAPEGFLASAPISSAARVGDVIYVSGQVGIDGDGSVVPGGVAGQTRACLEGLEAILLSMGASIRDVVQTRVFLTDFAGYSEFNSVYREFFSSPFPTRSTVGTSELALGAEVEIEAIAVLRGRPDPTHSPLDDTAEPGPTGTAAHDPLS
jgi:2-iminobutanoate/2-iminopropanoate deaminase